jgi:phosphoglycolate phosphatase-like HAD superfamily hydrolase
MANYGVTDLFDAIVGGNDTTEHKPSAIPVLRALEIMNVKPENAVMVGDLSVDIEAAKAAGLAGAIGILHGFGTAKMLKDAGADAIISTYDELEEAIQQIEAKQHNTTKAGTASKE